VAEGIGGEELQRVLRHERVHVAQMARLGIVRFLLAYVREYARHRLRGLPASQAYRRISFEEEAFAAEAEETV
jgi:alkylation response protein AidB-like acyl-CoA dehydrogenase